jgi:hypothetical protein
MNVGRGVHLAVMIGLGCMVLGSVRLVWDGRFGFVVDGGSEDGIGVVLLLRHTTTPLVPPLFSYATSFLTVDCRPDSTTHLGLRPFCVPIYRKVQIHHRLHRLNVDAAGEVISAHAHITLTCVVVVVVVSKPCNKRYRVNL